MITDALMGLAVSLFGMVAGLAVFPGPPGWATNFSAIGTVFQALGSMSVWFPTATVVLIIGAVFAARLIGMGVKVARMVLSLLTGGGGHTGG